VGTCTLSSSCRRLGTYGCLYASKTHFNLTRPSHILRDTTTSLLPCVALLPPQPPSHHRPPLTRSPPPTPTHTQLRKRFFPFGTVIELGADYNTQIGVWQFKSTWEDRFIGGRFSVKGRCVCACWWRLCICSRKRFAHACVCTWFQISARASNTQSHTHQHTVHVCGGHLYTLSQYWKRRVLTLIVHLCMCMCMSLYLPPHHPREIQFSKSWLVTLGDQDDIATRLKFRAGIDTATWRSYARCVCACVLCVLCRCQQPSRLLV
jgi:hypothetical protein